MLVIYLVSNYVIRRYAWVYTTHCSPQQSKSPSLFSFFARYKAKRRWFRSDIDTHLCCRAPNTSKAAGWAEILVWASQTLEHVTSCSSSTRVQAPFTHESRPGWKASSLALAEHSLLQSVWRWACLWHSTSDSLSLGCIPEMLKIPSY